jgi:hypothetical protein
VGKYEHLIGFLKNFESLARLGSNKTCRNQTPKKAYSKYELYFYLKSLHRSEVDLHRLMLSRKWDRRRASLQRRKANIEQRGMEKKGFWCPMLLNRNRNWNRRNRNFLTSGMGTVTCYYDSETGMILVQIYMLLTLLNSDKCTVFLNQWYLHASGKYQTISGWCTFKVKRRTRILICIKVKRYVDPDLHQKSGADLLHCGLCSLTH